MKRGKKVSIYPKYYCNNITEITTSFLKENDIKALILDVDNTLLDFDLNIVDGLEKWYEDIKACGIKAIIVSNSNKKHKIEKVADLLDIEYISLAMKPMKKGLRKAQEILNISPNNIAVIGDQIFTDVVGANRCHMFSILVKPLAEKDIWITKFKRPLERAVLKRYKKKI